MRLSPKGRHAVTALVDLTLHQGKAPVALSDISRSQGISLSYLEQLFSRLRRAGLVLGVRGPGGGYRLARDAACVSVAAVIDAVDESLDITRCKGMQNCRQGSRCLTHDLWSELSCQIREFLDGISLADLARQPDIIEVVARQDGHNQRRQGLRADS